MRLAILALACATLALAAPATADVTIDGPPVYVCVNDVCTPCPDPVVVPTPPNLSITYTGADCN